MSLVVIDGGAEHSRAVFDREARGAWSSALPLMLEKHGFLDVTTATLADLRDHPPRTRGCVMLVGQLPADTWTPDLIDLVMTSGPAIVEGPLPVPLADALGIEQKLQGCRDGRIAVVDAELRDKAQAYGVDGGGTLGASSSRPVDRPSELDWQSLSRVPIDQYQAAAWSTPGWDIARWGGVGPARVLAEIHELGGESSASPAIVAVGDVVACSFGLLTYLGQAHTSEPFGPSEHRSSNRTTGLETLLLGLIDELHARAGISRLRVLPWPAGYRWALSLRHDFDRHLGARTVQGILDRHRTIGTAATWYWRARHLRGPGADAGLAAIHRVRRDPAHEIALHTELIWSPQGDDERATVEMAIDAPVGGTSAHGDPSCFRFQGAPNVLWAEDQQLLYTELIQHAHLHPHRFAALGASGEITPLRVLCLPHHESFDRSAAGGDVDADRLSGLPERWMTACGFAQVLNHPDINIDALFGALAGLPGDERLDWTACQVADWWRRSHVVDELTVRRSGPSAFVISSARGVDRLVVELLSPDGNRREVVIDLEAGQTLTVGDDRVPLSVAPTTPAAGVLTGTVDARAAVARRRWDSDLSPIVAQQLRAWQCSHDVDPDAPASRSTVRTNTELVPDRAMDLTEMLRHLAPDASLHEARMLEAGAGFGALAIYLSMATPVHRVMAVDLKPDFMDVGRRVAAAASVTAIEFHDADLRALDCCADASIDVVVANNSMLYLKEREGLRRALAELYRALAPGGTLLIHQANRLQTRDPFTKAPLLHLLPAGLREPAARVTGLRHSRDRVLLLGTTGFRKELSRAGFTDVRTGAIMHGRMTSRPAHRFAGFFAIAGRRPGA